jgi:hypothetical protein
MCIICDQFKDGKLTLGEAVRNYGELKEILSEEHQKEIEEKIFNKIPFKWSVFLDQLNGHFEADARFEREIDLPGWRHSRQKAIEQLGRQRVKDLMKWPGSPQE